jgi:SLT domain-containing protein
MSAHQHKSNTKSIVSAGSSIAKSAAVAKLSAPERKAVRKAQAQSSKRVKNQHEIIMNSYINDAKIATVELDHAYRNYRDALKDEQTLLDTKQAFDDYTESVKKNGTESDITAEKAIILKGKLLDYAEKLGGLPPEAVTMVMAQIDQGSIDDAEAALKVLFLAAPSHSRAYSISRSKPLEPLTLDDVPHKAGGGITKKGITLVGEQGPELVMMNGGENVLTASQTASAMAGGGSPSGIGGGASINLTVHAGLGTDGNAVGQQIVNMLKQYQRTNGPFDFTSR